MKRFSVALALLACALFPSTHALAQNSPVTLKNGVGAIIDTFTTIQAAYNAIPPTLTQAYKLELGNAYDYGLEVFPVTFVEKAGAGPSNTISIVQAPGTYITIAGGTDLHPLFVFDGADWITISGYSPGSTLGRLNFYYESADTTGWPATRYPFFHFKNGASHNRLSFLRLSNTSDEDTLHDAPAITVGGTNTSNGNDSNYISNCQFRYSD